jgi:hypothetical protein
MLYLASIPIRGRYEEVVAVRTIVLDMIEWGETPKGTVRDEKELNTRLGI